jgi:hypothetical protein
VRANATPEFPPFIQQYWQLSFTPDCTLCHTTPSGGLGTANTPFATYLRSRGLVAYDVTSLQNALDADRGERHISDGSGLDDYDALRSGHDPNLDEGVTSSETPGYGFSCATSPGRGGGMGAWGCLLAALVWLRRRAKIFSGVDRCQEGVT